MWVLREVTKNQQRAEQAALFPLGLPSLPPTTTYSITRQQPGLPRPGEHLQFHPLIHNRCTETKNTAQMKEKIKVPEKIQQSDEEIANLSDVQFKPLVIRKLTELIQLGHKMKEK